MALKIPFKKETFPADMKERVSGNNLSLDFTNLQSSLTKVGVEVAKIISKKMYDTLCDYTSGNEKFDVAKDYLKRAVLHFTMYQHLIHLITRIGNDGVTVKKNDDETTIFKYQQDQLENKFISDAWFWLDELIKYMNENPDDFPDWINSDESKEYDELPVGLDDFTKWVGVSSLYFIINVRWIIREVWNECVLSRLKNPVDKTDNIAKAVCYDVMGRACMRLAYFALPEPIRVDYNNEMGKNHAEKADSYIRERVAAQYRNKAESYWLALESEIANNIQLKALQNVSPEPYKPKGTCESDKFVSTK